MNKTVVASVITGASGVYAAVSINDIVVPLVGIVGGVALGIGAVWQKLQDDRVTTLLKKIEIEQTAHEQTIQTLKDTMSFNDKLIKETNELQEKIQKNTNIITELNNKINELKEEIIKLESQVGEKIIGEKIK